MQRSQPYPDRPDAFAALSENPARFLHYDAEFWAPVVKGIHSLQRLAWWERVAHEEGYETGGLLAERRAVLVEEMDEPDTDDQPTPAEQSRIDATVAAIEQAETVAEVTSLQQEEIAREETAKEVIAAANQRLDELQPDAEDVEDESEATTENPTDSGGDGDAECPFCGYVDATAAFFDAHACPSCGESLDAILGDESGVERESETQPDEVAV